jgi:hypothetical protein
VRYFYNKAATDLPDHTKLKGIKLPGASVVLDRKGERFAEVFETLKKAFDVVIIDSPPMQLVSDALVLSQFATTVLYVVKADSTPYPLARHGLTQMKRISEPGLAGLGVVDRGAQRHGPTLRCRRRWTCRSPPPSAPSRPRCASGWRTT